MSLPAVKVSAIVVAYGKEELLRECLSSVEAALEQVDGETELVVVANRLDERTRKDLEGSTSARVVSPSRNLGFAGGVNAGIEVSRGEWIAVVNDDCVLEGAAIAELLAATGSRGEIGSVSPKVVFADRPGVINSAGLEIDELGIAYERLLGEPVSAGGEEVAEVFGASGTAALYRRAMLDELGGFDESFFAYLEDADLAWRARMAGWRCVYTPRALVRHHHSASFGHGSAEKHFLVGRNRVRMLAKNASAAQLRRCGPAMLAYDLAYVVWVALRRRTLSPLVGRARGLREWRVYRNLAGSRDQIPLERVEGLHRALHRNRAYRP